MLRALSRKTQCRQRASMMTVAAYQRHGWSQSGRQLMVWPQARHRKRRTQMTIQALSVRPRTWRQYRPWPTSRRTPFVSRAGSPQKTQNFRRRLSTDGASGLRAQSCSTEMARLCRMTSVSFGGGGDRRVSRKRRASPPPPSSSTVGHPIQISRKSTSTRWDYAVRIRMRGTAQSGRMIEAEMILIPWARMMRERFKPAIQFAA